MSGIPETPLVDTLITNLLCYIDSYMNMRTGALVQWLKMPSWKVRDRGFELHSDLQVSKKQNVSSPLTREDLILSGASKDREVAFFKSCVWRAVSSHLSHHSQVVLLAHFSLYVHKGGLKPHVFHFIYQFDL